MKNKRFFAVVFLAFLSAFILGSARPTTQSEPADLADLLKKTSAYCQKLSDSVLNFVCTEAIRERIDYNVLDKMQKDPWTRSRSMIGARTDIQKAKAFPTKVNTFVYDYQLIKKSKALEEHRTMLEDNGRKTEEKDASLKTEYFAHKYVVLGPVGLLSEQAQEQHDYRIIKEEKIDGKKTAVVEAVPKNPAEVSHLYGRIWIDRDDGGILKIEWVDKSLGNFDKIQELGRKLNAEPRITTVSEYGVVKNGIRFPSEYSVREAYLDKHGKAYVRSETSVVYKDYKFFQVETDVKVRDGS